MKHLEIKALGAFDLTEVYDRIADGELGSLVKPETLKGPSRGGGAFLAGRGRTPKITIQLKHSITPEEQAELEAKLRAMFGTNAHIHISG